MKTKNLKMVIVFVVILLAIIVFNTNTANATTDEIVNIKDSKLKSELLTYDTNKDGELSKSEMESITVLELDNKGITDLTGLDSATNLYYLMINDNAVTDISVLAKLTNMTDLGISNNKITDISVVKNFTKLGVLLASNCNITDISALKDLTNLYKLDLSHNNIESISALSNISKIIKLERLYLNDNKITDITPIAQLSNLDILDLSNNYITDLTPTNTMKNIDILKTEGQKTTNVDVTDKTTGITLNANSGVVPANTQLIVKAISKETTNTVKESLKDMAKYTAYDITLLSDNKAVQPNGKVTIKFAIPNGYDKTRLTVYRIAENGTKTQYDTKIVGNYAVFETDHFSTYVLAEKKATTNTDNNKPTTTNKGEKDDTPKTGTIDIIGYVLFTTAISGIGIIALKKKSK